MKKIIATVGAALSGKSTFINDFAKKHGYPIICPDTLRAKFGWGEGDQSVSGKVFKAIPDLFDYEFLKGDVVCYDATNYSAKNRKLIEDIADQWKASVEWHIFIVPYETLLKRQLTRSRQVPADVIKRQCDNLTIPTSGKVIYH